MLHKFYYVEGGAERYVFNLTELLKQKGHEVIPFAMQDDRNFDSPYSCYFAPRFGPDMLFETKNPVRRLKIAAQTIYNRKVQDFLKQLLEDTKPDIAHVHSVYHHLSPSVFPILKEYNLPVLVTLHDYKLVCPNYIFLDGQRHVCELCKGKYFWNATRKKCFRDSYAASFLVTLEAYINYWKKSYQNNIDVLVSPSKFLADKIAKYGYENKEISVLPYTLDLNTYVPCFQPSDYFVFMGRLTHEKGVDFLLDAMSKIKETNLYLLGTGPLQNHLQNRIEKEGLTHVRLLGYKSGDELLRIVSQAKFTVITSEWYDNSPLVIYESLALGNPVIGANMGGIPELISENRDGFIFERGDIDTFIDRVNYLVQNPQICIQMGKNAREKAEQLFGFEEHYKKINQLYDLTFSKSREKNKKIF